MISHAVLAPGNLASGLSAHAENRYHPRQCGVPGGNPVAV